MAPPRLPGVGTTSRIADVRLREAQRELDQELGRQRLSQSLFGQVLGGGLEVGRLGEAGRQAQLEREAALERAELPITAQVEARKIRRGEELADVTAAELEAREFAEFELNLRAQPGTRLDSQIDARILDAFQQVDAGNVDVDLAIKALDTSIRLIISTFSPEAIAASERAQQFLNKELNPETLILERAATVQPAGPAGDLLPSERRTAERRLRAQAGLIPAGPGAPIGALGGRNIRAEQRLKQLQRDIPFQPESTLDRLRGSFQPPQGGLPFQPESTLDRLRRTFETTGPEIGPQLPPEPIQGPLPPEEFPSLDELGGQLLGPLPGGPIGTPGEIEDEFQLLQGGMDRRRLRQSAIRRALRRAQQREFIPEF